MSEKTIPLAVTGLILALSAVSGTSLMVAFDAKRQNDELSKQVAALSAGQDQAFGKLMELDAGMISMAKVAGLDGAKLSKVMMAELNEMRAAAQRSAATKAQQLSVEDHAVADQPKEQKAAVADTAAAAQPKAADGKSVDQAPANAAADAGNPFVELVAEAKALTITKQTPMTMQKIDSLLVQRVSENWVKPSGDVKGLRTELQMKLGRDGNMASVEVTKSSGNKQFDASAAVALRNIGRMPEISQLDQETYEKAYKSRTIVFSPEMLAN